MRRTQQPKCRRRPGSPSPPYRGLRPPAATEDAVTCPRVVKPSLGGLLLTVVIGSEVGRTVILVLDASRGRSGARFTCGGRAMRSRRRQDGALRQVKQVRCHAADEEALDGSRPMRARGDQVGVL